MNGLTKLIGGVLLAGLPSTSWAAELPAHDPLRILIVSDEVNPHGLSDAELTQPGDLSAAIGDPASGIQIDSLDEVDSQCVDDALTALAQGVDVLVHFAHLPSLGCDGSDREAELVAAVEQHLADGGGVVVFHHGIYEWAGKEAILQLFGARASSIAWDTANGQDVIAVAPQHVVASQGVDYDGTRMFGGAGVEAGEYPFFTNTPDERYDAFGLLTEPNEDRTILFASAEADGGAARVLGYDLNRVGWAGHVVFYQPGEYQPQALDDLGGNNFQILANAILYVGITEEDDGGGATAGGTGGGDDTGATEEGGSGDGAGTGDTTSSDGGTAATGGTTPSSAAAEDDGSGCSCRAGGVGPLGLPWLALVAGLGLSRRRRGR
ncbi:MAG: hypothetical protein AB1Z98_11325 [Nannocystaceae bacterium]